MESEARDCCPVIDAVISPVAGFCLFAALVVSGCKDQKSQVLQQERHNEILIKQVTITSPERELPFGPVDVLIRDGIIAEIDRGLSDSGLQKEAIIDASGLFLSPGLIDGHTHLSEIPGMLFEHQQESPDIVQAARAQFPRSYLYHGFTTVVDLNANAGLINEWNAREIGPRAYFCGAAPILDGYPTSNIPPPLRYERMPFFLIDDSRMEVIPEGVEPSEHSPEAIVDRLQTEGAICVKTHYEPGFGGSHDLPTPSVELIRRLKAAAQEKNMPVLLHANSQTAQAFGVKAGVDAMAHGMWTWNDASLTEADEEIVSLLEAMVQQEIAWQATIQVIYGERDIHDPDYFSQPELRNVLPQSLIDWYRTEDGQWFRKRLAQSLGIEDIGDFEAVEKLYEPAILRVNAVLSYLAGHGGLLLFGSDTPSDATFANPPGLNGRMEMRRWKEAGLAPLRIFQAATINNARFFGLQDELGTIEVGKRADLLLLSENPMQDISAFDTIDTLILGERVLSRSELSAGNMTWE